MDSVDVLINSTLKNETDFRNLEKNNNIKIKIKNSSVIVVSSYAI